MSHAKDISRILSLMENIGETANLKTNQFRYDRATKTMYAGCSELGLSGFPKTLLVTSTVTGREVQFIKDYAAAEANEFWDGEMCEYIPATDANLNVKKLVITAE